VVEKSFTVLKPFWLTWPVLLGFAVTGGAAGVGGYRWRRKLRSREEIILPTLTQWRLAVLSPDLPTLKGTLLDGRFEVGDVLARGGFATVFKGRDRQEGKRPCAIKIFRQDLAEKSSLDERFQEEVTALRQVDHPNVVRIYGHGAVPQGAPYLAMEFIQGRTLRDVLKSKTLDRRLAANYLRQMGNALAAIHARRISHRDVKPENLMIRNQARPGLELVLIDFSIALVKDPDETMHGLSRAAGTIHYMAPEQAMGYADASSDIYSLAKVVIEMLTGQRLSALLPKASMDLPGRVRELLTERDLGLSQQTVELIGAALEFDPARRPQDTRAFAEKICGDLEGESGG
jgi:serine/threonine-protein kinase